MTDLPKHCVAFVDVDLGITTCSEEERWDAEARRLLAYSHELTPIGLAPLMRHLYRSTEAWYTRRVWFGSCIFEHALKWWEQYGGLVIPAPGLDEQLDPWGLRYERAPHYVPAEDDAR